MATYYLDSTATGTGDGLSWVNACTTLLAAIAKMAAGDDLNVYSGHAETLGTAALTFPSTYAAPCRIFSCDRTNAPALSSDLVAGATFNKSGAGNAFIGGYIYAWGLNCNVSLANFGVGSNVGRATMVLENCAFPAGVSLLIGSSGTAQWSGGRFQNCLFAASIVNGGGNWEWRNCTWSASSAALFTSNNNEGGSILLDGCDLTALGSGKTLFSDTTQSVTSVVLLGCALNALATVAVQQTDSRKGFAVDLLGCDSGGLVLRNERWRAQAVLTTDTVDVRSGGATQGGVPVAWTIITSASAKWHDPFECLDLVKPNAQVGAPFTINIAIMSNAVLTNADIWPEVEYLGTAGSTLASRANGGTPDPLAAGVAWPLDTASQWNTTGVAGPVQQVMSVTIAPKVAGDVRVKVRIAKASQTLRVDPLLQGF